MGPIKTCFIPRRLLPDTIDDHPGDALGEDLSNRCVTRRDHGDDSGPFWQHVLPYGEVKLDMTARLSIQTTPPNDPPASPIESP